MPARGRPPGRRGLRAIGGGVMTSGRSFRFGVVAGRPSSGADWLAAAPSTEAPGDSTRPPPGTTFTPAPLPALAAAAAAAAPPGPGPPGLSPALRAGGGRP